MHTHFGSATLAISAFFSVLLVGTLWRLLAYHGLTSKNATVQGLSRAALNQY
jgi:hypothetical protein